MRTPFLAFTIYVLRYSSFVWCLYEVYTESPTQVVAFEPFTHEQSPTRDDVEFGLMGDILNVGNSFISISNIFRPYM